MKLLVLGIDGGDERIFRAFDMPNLKGLMASGVSTTITEDLWSRGWAEMLTNEDVLGMGGTYARPVADGTHAFTQKFGKSNIEANHSITPLWDLLAERGIASGFMNVPGTFPAMPVNGFMVSGAGAGLGKIAGVPSALCSSEAVREELERLQYIADTRFIASGIKDEQALFERLETMLERRIDAFIKLTRTHHLDFGMLALMATQRVQYLAMSEIQDYIQRVSMAEGSSWPLSSLQERIAKLYTTLDTAIGRLMNELEPDHYILTADHAAEPFKFTANANPFLERIGMFQWAPNHTLWRTVLKIPKVRALAYSGLPKFAKKTWQEIQLPVGSGTRAFGFRHIPGIYLYDERFGGGVGAEDSADLVDEIVERFNQDPEARTHQMSASPYRRNHMDSPFERMLPDIWIDKPDNIFFEGEGGFVEPNPCYGPVADLKSVPKDMNSGIKGRHPIFVTDPATASMIEEGDPRTLTLVYRLTDRLFAAGAPV